MSFDQLVKVEVHGNVAVRQDHIALFLSISQVRTLASASYTGR